MKTVLVIGSVSIDYVLFMDKFPSSGETLVGKSREIRPGGKGENQAVALSRSNKVITNMVCAVGNDLEGKQILDVLKKNKVNTSFIIVDCEVTGNATIFVDSTGQNKIVIIPGANAKLRSEDIDIKLIENCDYVVIQNEIPEVTNEFVIKQASKLGKIVVYNPAPFRKFNEELLGFIDYFMPNEVELFQYTKMQNPFDGAKFLIEKGVKNVVVTLGENGSLFVNKNQAIKVDAKKVKVIDTVAAGDTYVGYFVASLASGLDIKKSMEYATIASSICVSKKGSLDSIPNGEDIGTL